MSTDEVPPGAEIRRDNTAPTVAPAAPAVLHGRLLNVSRMATIGEMAAGVAHELNQPLTAIAAYAQACDRLLARPLTDPTDLRQALREITAQTARAAEILRRLRALARSQHGEHLPADLNALVTELHDLIQTDAHVHGVRLSLQLATELPEVLVDTGQIQQVILNLVRNSLDAFAARPGETPEISIRTSVAPSGEVELAVTDNGPGLTPEATQRLFDPFFSTKENGTGLGLAISNTIARNHGGSLGYRPIEPSGARFHVLLPARPQD